MRAAPFVLVVFAFAANGQTIVVDQAPRAPARNYANLRIGSSTSATRPELCLDVAPLDFLSLEACGTGSGFLHRDANPEIAHFRAGFVVKRFQLSTSDVALRVHAGFAEIQIGEDDPGFQFTSVGPRGVETAGPAVGVSTQLLVPVALGVELVGTFNVSALWVPFAPQLKLPLSPLQPSVSFSLGLGF